MRCTTDCNSCWTVVSLTVSLFGTAVWIRFLPRCDFDCDSIVEVCLVGWSLLLVGIAAVVAATALAFD